MFILAARKSSTIVRAFPVGRLLALLRMDGFEHVAHLADLFAGTWLKTFR